MKFKHIFFFLTPYLVTVDCFCPAAVRIKRATTISGPTSCTISLKSTTDKRRPVEFADDHKYCLPLEKVSLQDLPRVGGKTASLGEMIQRLTPLGVDVPGGFAVTVDAYDAVLDRFRLRERLELLMKGIDGKCGHIRYGNFPITERTVSKSYDPTFLISFPLFSTLCLWGFAFQLQTSTT